MVIHLKITKPVPPDFSLCRYVKSLSNPLVHCRMGQRHRVFAQTGRPFARIDDQTRQVIVGTVGKTQNAVPITRSQAGQIRSFESEVFLRDKLYNVVDRYVMLLLLLLYFIRDAEKYAYYRSNVIN